MPMNVKADYVKLAREKMAGLGLAFQSSSWSNQNPEEVSQTFENFLKVWRQDGIPRGR
jgi:hypothetical protein